MSEEASQQPYQWNALHYFTKVDWIPEAWFQWYKTLEIVYLQSIPNLPSKTIIDMGAGFGRILPFIAPHVRQVIAVELDENMFSVLEQHARAYSNMTAIRGDYTRLEEVLRSMSIENPVVVSLQNSLGTTYGDMWKGVSEFRKVAEKGKGDVIMSVFNSEAFDSFGLQLYHDLEEMVGEIDEQLTDAVAGLFVSKIGYRSQWFGPELRQRIKAVLGGTLMAELNAPQFTIIHVAYR